MNKHYFNTSEKEGRRKWGEKRIVEIALRISIDEKIRFGKPVMVEYEISREDILAACPLS